MWENRVKADYSSAQGKRIARRTSKDDVGHGRSHDRELDSGGSFGEPSASESGGIEGTDSQGVLRVRNEANDDKNQSRSIVSIGRDQHLSMPPSKSLKRPIPRDDIPQSQSWDPLTADAASQPAKNKRARTEMKQSHDYTQYHTARDEMPYLATPSMLDDTSQEERTGLTALTDAHSNTHEPEVMSEDKLKDSDDEFVSTNGTDDQSAEVRSLESLQGLYQPTQHRFRKTSEEAVSVRRGTERRQSLPRSREEEKPSRQAIIRVPMRNIDPLRNSEAEGAEENGSVYDEPDQESSNKDSNDSNALQDEHISDSDHKNDLVASDGVMKKTSDSTSGSSSGSFAELPFSSTRQKQPGFNPAALRDSSPGLPTDSQNPILQELLRSSVSSTPINAMHDRSKGKEKSLAATVVAENIVASIPRAVEDYMEAMKQWEDEHLELGVPTAILDRALKATNGNLELANDALFYLIADKNIPDSWPGIWTDNDDRVLMAQPQDERAVQSLIRKHGNEALRERYEYLRAYEGDESFQDLG